MSDDLATGTTPALATVRPGDRAAFHEPMAALEPEQHICHERAGTDQPAASRSLLRQAG